jgi:hypothetical protein
MKREREREKKLANEGEVTELKQKDKKTTKWLYVSQKKKTGWLYPCVARTIYVSCLAIFLNGCIPAIPKITADCAVLFSTAQ